MKPEATQVPVKLQQALQLHQAGRLTQARALYEEILSAQPGHSDAINLLGALAVQARDLRSAVELFGRAIQIDPNNVAAHCNRGLAFWELRELDAALASYDEAIALNNDVAESHFSRGRVLRELRQLEPALASLQQATAIEADYAEAFLYGGHVLRELGRPEAALHSYDRAIAIVADYEEAHLGRGVVLRELQQWAAALASCNRAIELKPDYAEAYCHRGNVLYDLKQWEAALAGYDKAIALKPEYVKAHFDRGNVLYQLRQWKLAGASFDRAVALKPDYAEAYCNRGLALREINQLDAALASYDQAIALRPDFAQAHGNRGLVLHQLSQCEAALASYDRAIALKPDVAIVYYNRSLTHLLQGDFERGWVGYDRRWDSVFVDSELKRNFAQPRWLGAPTLVGKTMLLCWEQGLGDTLQFCRYAQLISDLGGLVILEVQESLRNLLTTVQGVSQIVCSGERLPAFDYHCPLMSLPLAFKTRLETIPAKGRYLHSDAKKVAQWQARLGQKKQVRVGLVWSGGTLHKNDRDRSIPLVELIRDLPVGFQYVSLQKEVREADRKALQSHPGILQFSDDLIDFSDSAALCECLDVVISVDTSAAHLSAALGKPTWILLPFVPDWRWLLDREDSPWYPTARLFRQQRPGDWESVVRRAGTELGRLTGRMTP